MCWRSLCVASILVASGTIVTGADTQPVEGQAWIGNPFGVAAVSVTVPEAGQNKVAEPDQAITESSCPQALYPALAQRRTADRDESTTSTTTTLYFLFRSSDSPPALTVSAAGQTIELTPETGADEHAELLGHWWKAYVGAARRAARADQYPLELDQYLTSMLARRLDLETPKVQVPTWLQKDELSEFTSHLIGTEAVRLAMQKDALLNTDEPPAAATQPLPKAVSPPPVEIPEPPEWVEIEPIAMAVPPECLYVRFGSYQNMDWFREKIDEWGTDLRNILAGRAVNYDIARRFQDRIQLHENQLTALLGPAVIADVAIIGSDTFVREGAGLGVLFQAANNELLSAEIRRQRKACAAERSDVTLTTLTIPGHTTQATMLTSADHRVRSCYVRSGDFHLITPSVAIATRFLDVTEGGKESLGESREFRYARSVTPLTRNDSALIYLSDAFFRLFVDPAFRIEMTRRAQSEMEIQLVQFARLAAEAEKQPSDSLESLIAGGFLPRNFGRRADGSQLILRDDVISDSIRGRRGHFIPVRDVPVTHATPAEVKGYAEFTRMYRRVWANMDPATIAVSRSKQDHRETLSIDLHVFPVPRSTYGILAMFASPPAQTQWNRPDQVLMLFEANFFGTNQGFIGFQDHSPLVTNEDGEIRSKWLSGDSILDDCFIGVAPWQTLQQFLRGGYEWPADQVVHFGEQYRNAVLLGIRNEKVGVVAYDDKTLETVFPEMELVKAERPAQYRFTIGDLAHAQFTTLLHALAWEHANRISEGHALWLNRLSSQLGVAPMNAQTTATSLLLGSLNCPLGGRFELTGENGHQSWQSTRDTPWDDWTLPLLDRLRGAIFEMTIKDQTLTTHVELVTDTDLD